MECPFHAGDEAITTCVQCETPICPVCAAETNQIHLCMNCYRARVEELSLGLGSVSARLAKDRQKAEAKISRKSKKGKDVVATLPEPQASFDVGAESSLWEKEEVGPPLAAEMAPAPDTFPVPAPPFENKIESPQPFLPPEAAFVAPSGAPEIPFEEPLSKKEMARLKKEEAKQMKAEAREAKKAKKGAPVAEAAPAISETIEFQEPASKKEVARLKKEEAKQMKAEAREAKRAKKAPVETEPEVLAMDQAFMENGPEAPQIPFQEPLSKKELARLKKEEAKRLKAEEKEAKKAQKDEVLAEPIPMPQRLPEAPFFEAAPPLPPADLSDFSPPPAPPEAEAQPAISMPDFSSPPPPPPAPESQPSLNEMPIDFEPDTPSQGMKLPRLEERLEPSPPERRDDRGRMPEPPDRPSGPPEGFFD